MNPDLEAFIDETVRVSANHHYHPTTFISMRQRHGTVEAINRLVVSGDVQSGFKRLKELGLLDYSIEAAILKFPHEFPRSSRECAEFRLRIIGSVEGEEKN
jgi:hypothetical protein